MANRCFVKSLELIVVKGRFLAAFFLWTSFLWIGINFQCAAQEYTWNLPPGFPVPMIPNDNPMNAAKVELGRRLFFDTRLSIDQSYACASCHQPERAFTDGLKRARGVHGDLHPRNSMSIFNVAYSPVLGWDGRVADSLEQQVLVPMFNRNPPELGLTKPIDDILQALRGDTNYPQQFANAFGIKTEITLDNIAKAIAAFERTLIAGNSPYDRYVFNDDETALNQDQLAGMTLFFSQEVGCSRCHGGFTFSSPIIFDGSAPAVPVLHNNGIAGESEGGQAMPFFKAPSLRNISLTAPYMHDGRFQTLGEVLQHYRRQQRFFTYLPESDEVQAMSNEKQLTELELKRLEAFLYALTDEV